MKQPTHFIILAAIAQAAFTEAKSETSDQFITAVEQAHGRALFETKSAVAMDYQSKWGGRKGLKGRFIIARDTSQIRAEIDDGTVIVWDGSEAWVSPSSSEFKGARFHILTWPYFLLAPMKLGDPGSHLKLLGKMPLSGTECDAGKLTFDKSVGDAPDDWYVVYRDPETSLLKAMAYIVTYSKPVAEAEKEPHAITYEDYATVEGVKFATRWRFWHWSEEKGIHGDPIAEASVSNLKFVTPVPETFAKPDDARSDPKPTP